MTSGSSCATFDPNGAFEPGIRIHVSEPVSVFVRTQHYDELGPESPYITVSSSTTIVTVRCIQAFFFFLVYGTAVMLYVIFVLVKILSVRNYCITNTISNIFISILVGMPICS